MKYLPWIIALMIGVVIFGCGGSGGSSSGSASASATATATATGGTDTFVTQLIAESSPGVQVDPTNLQVGDHVTFRVALIDETTRTYTTSNAGNYTTTDRTGSAGVLSITTGAYTATASSNGTTFTVSTVGLATNYSTTYGVKSVQARVTGSLFDTNGFSVPFATVLFKDSGGNVVGQAQTFVNGGFNGSVPTTAVRFNLLSSSYNATVYYSLFSYGAGSYGPLIPTCNAPLPSLTGGVTTALPNQVLLAAVSATNGAVNPPPPPPTCSP